MKNYQRIALKAKQWGFILLALLFFSSSAEAKVKTVKIQNLSTMVSDIFPKNHDHEKKVYTHAEWGFAALIEIETTTGTKQILFDTGAYKETVLGNIQKLGVDFKPEYLVLSHFHTDHTGGLTALKKAFPEHLNTVYFGDKILAPRRKILAGGSLGTQEENTFIGEYQRFLDASPTRPKEVSIKKSVVLTDIDEDVMLVYRPDSKTFQDLNTAGNPYKYLGDDGQYQDDDLPEEIALVINTPHGLIVISGCAHRGILNTVDSSMEDSKNKGYNERVFALVGGYHLLFSDQKKMAFEGQQMPYNDLIGEMIKRWEVKLFWGSHCTGNQAVAAILKALKGPNAKLSDGFEELDRKKIIEGRAGQTFTYDGTEVPIVTKGLYR